MAKRFKPTTAGAVLCRACADALGRADEWKRDEAGVAACDLCGRRNLCVLMPVQKPLGKEART